MASQSEAGGKRLALPTALLSAEGVLPTCAGSGRDSSVRPDWAHLFLSVLPALPLDAGKQEEQVAGGMHQKLSAKMQSCAPTCLVAEDP